MAGITSTGIGSGLDISSLVSQLVAAEGEPASNRLNLKEAKFQAQISSFGMLKSALSDLQSALQGLKDGTSFTTQKAVSANENVFTVAASPTAVAGSYGVEVLQLAEKHKLRSVGFTGATSVVGAGTLTITVNSSSFDLTIDSSNQTLEGIRDAINGATDNVGVAATIVNVDDGGGGTESRLVLTSDMSGTSGEITVAADDDDLNDTDASGLSQLVYNKGVTENMVQLTAALDSQIKLDQQTVTRSGNTLSDVIDGVAISLVKADVGNAHDLTVSRDTSVATEAINSLVSNFNSLADTFDDLGNYDAETETAGVLIGDATLRILEASIRDVLGSNVDSAVVTMNNLALLGITTDENGHLAVNSSELDAAITDNPDTVSALFSATDGIATVLDEVLDDYTKLNGIIGTREDGLQDSVDDIGDQRVALSTRLESLEARLLAQFGAMDALVAQFNATGSFLTQQSASLQALISGRNS